MMVKHLSDTDLLTAITCLRWADLTADDVQACCDVADALEAELRQRQNRRIKKNQAHTS